MAVYLFPCQLNSQFPYTALSVHAFPFVTWLACSQGRGKKDAKQVAAAALLESLLNQQGQTEADFLQPGKAKLQKAVQVASFSTVTCVSTNGPDCSSMLSTDINKQSCVLSEPACLRASLAAFLKAARQRGWLRLLLWLLLSIALLLLCKSLAPFNSQSLTLIHKA